MSAGPGARPDKYKKALNPEGLLHATVFATLRTCYFGNKLHGRLWNPLNWKSDPTAIGWSETTWTLADTFAPPSGESVGVCQVTISVFNEPTETVLLPVWPGYCALPP